MPTLLPDRLNTETKRPRHVSGGPWIDVLGLFVLSLGLAAVVIASILYFACDDNVNASFVLFGAAALVTLLAHGSANFDD